MILSTAMLVAAVIAEVAPKIWSLVKKIEEIIPEAGMGNLKKKLVMDALLDDALAIADSLTPGVNLEKIRPILVEHLGKAIDTTVSLINSVKYFQRVKLNPADFGESSQAGFMRSGLNLLLTGIFAIALMISLFACGGSKLGTESLYSGPMAGTGKTAIYVTGACVEAQECAGGELLAEGLPNLEILGPEDSTKVDCNSEVAGSCYNPESRTVILPVNPNEEAILTACLYDWSYQVTGDPDFKKTGEPWARGCDKPFRVVE